MLCYVMLCYVMLCYVMLCYVMLCYVMLCYVMLCYVMLCYVMFKKQDVAPWKEFSLMVRWVVGSILRGRPIDLFLIPASAPQLV